MSCKGATRQTRGWKGKREKEQGTLFRKACRTVQKALYKGKSTWEGGLGPLKERWKGTMRRSQGRSRGGGKGGRVFAGTGAIRKSHFFT